MKLYNITGVQSSLDNISLYVNYDSLNKQITIQQLYNEDQINYIPPNTAAFLKITTLGVEKYLLDPSPSYILSDISMLKSGSNYDFQYWALTWLPNGGGLSIPTDIFRVNTATKFSSPPYQFGEHMPVFTMFRPFSITDFNDCICFSSLQNLCLDGDSFDVESLVFDTDSDFFSFRQGLFPKVTLTYEGSLTPNNSIIVSANINPVSVEGVELFFENINGQISHNRRITTDGNAWIRVAAPMMDVGDTVRIKVNSKFFKGISDITIPVIAEV